MANALQMAVVNIPGANGFTAASQTFCSFTGTMWTVQKIIAWTGGGTEDAVATPFQAGTLSNMWVNVTTGTSAAGSSTVRSRIAKGDGAQTFTIAQGATGAQTDATHTDSPTAGQLVDIAITPTDTLLYIGVIGMTFAASSQTVTRIASSQRATSSASGSAQYMQIAGIPAVDVAITTTETGTKCRMKKAVTAKNLSFYVRANGTGSSTVKSRRSGAAGGNGNLTYTVGASATGLMQDTTNTDSIVVDDDYDITITPGNTTIGVNIFTMAVDYQSATGDTIFHIANNQGRVRNANGSSAFGLCGDMYFTGGGEANDQIKVNSAFVFSYPTIVVSAITMSTTSNLQLYVNSGVQTNPNATIGTTTGIYTDSTNTYTAAATDLVCFELTAGATGTSLTFTDLSVYGHLATSTTYSRSIAEPVGRWITVQ